MSATYQSRHAGALRDGDEAAAERRAEQKPLGGLAGWIDDRTGTAKGMTSQMRKVFPEHWSFMLGEIAMYSLIVCLLTGVFLTFWFVPSMTPVVYDGSYVPLQGVMVSDAYRSTLDISFDIRGGLLIRQIHHWAALIFVVAVFVHMARIFFTGAFRKPREINWVFGTILSLLACIEGFAGYSLPDDLLSGTGIRAMNGFVQSAPIIGSYLSYFIFGGAFPGEPIIPLLYSVHILLSRRSSSACSRRTSCSSSCTSTRSTPGRAAPTTTSSATRSCRSTSPRPAASSSSCSASSPSSRPSSRSTRSGPTDPTTRPPSPPAPSRTGTWASPTAPCACCRAGSSSSRGVTSPGA